MTPRAMLVKQPRLAVAIPGCDFVACMLQVRDTAHLLFILLLFALDMPMAASAAMAIGVDAA